jgi:enoyl-CoA hydratase/carnithine racemase
MTMTPDQTQLVLAEQRDAVLLLTLNRPERLNAWNSALEDQYFELLSAADADPAVRAIVVTGAGRAFCAGADLDGLREVAETGAGSRRVNERRSRSYPYTVRKPLIAAINGPAVGLGFVQAMYCDVRFATADAKLITAFSRRGLIAEYGIAWLLPRLVGRSRALDLLLSARTVLGEEAARIGLVDRVVDGPRLLDEACAYANELSRLCSPWSMAAIKRQVHESADQPFAAALEDSERLMLESFSGVDIKEGIDSYLEKREPEFAPLTSGERA